MSISAALLFTTVVFFAKPALPHMQSLGPKEHLILSGCLQRKRGRLLRK
jgi:hypothetical protein